MAFFQSKIGMGITRRVFRGRSGTRCIADVTPKPKRQSTSRFRCRRMSNVPPEPTGFRQKKGTVPKIITEYHADKQVDDNGLLFSTKTLEGPIKFGILAVSTFVGLYALLEMPVQRQSDDHVFKDIRKVYLQYKYNFFGVKVPEEDEQPPSKRE